MPLREAHAHLAQHGRAMAMLQLADCANMHDCLERIAHRASDHPRDHWLLGHGLRIESWPEPRYPTLAELDDAGAGHPCCLWSFDYHALVVSPAALRTLNIAGNTPDPPSGRILRDTRGQPTGVMLERAAKMVWERIPEPSPAQWRELVRAAAADLATHGFDEVHDLLSQPWLGPVLADLSDAGQLPLGVDLYPLLPDLDAAVAGAPGWQRPGVRLAGAKLFADGTLNSRTAFLLHPYADPLPGLPRGQQMLDQQQLLEALAATSRAGLTLAVHAIGDAAVRAVLDAAEALARTATPLRLRIEHAEIVDERDIPRFRQLGVTASVQPCHLLADIEALTRAVPDRLDRVLPLRDLIDSGLAPGRDLVFGSDTPIVRPHPDDSIQAAVHRRRPGMAAHESIAPYQAITGREAWACFARS
jgi:predicted amidohydrolase YtcJ